MVFSKEHLYAIAEQLPSEFDLDELIEKLLILDRLKRGQKDIREGRFHSQDEVEKMVQSWRVQ
jgi:predicted transcriptional regulator